MRRRSPWLYVLTLLVVAGPAAAGEGIANETDWGETDFREFIPTLGRNFTRGLFSSDNLPPLLIGTVATATVYNYDHSIYDAVAGDPEVFGHPGQVIGGPAVMCSVVGACMIAAPMTENKRFRAFTFTLGQAFIMNEVLMRSLKVAFDRTRPNQKRYSFPSGHSSVTFMFATLIDHYYGRKFSIPAYALASLVSWSRVESGKHYPSDIVFGATLGYLAARTAIHTHSKATSKLSFLPYVGPGSGGVTFVLRL